MAEDIKIVMIIGKYFSTYDEIEKHIFLARQLSRMVWSIPGGGLGVFTPHLNTAHFEVLTRIGEPVYQAFDRAMIERAGDAGIVVPNWRDSSGSLKEIDLFNRLGRPVFEELESLIAWRDNNRADLILRPETVRGATRLITQLRHRHAPALTIQDLWGFMVSQAVT